MSNHLAQESSPYLRQHVDNPVDWYPWGDVALERARAEDRPILLSIGYSACHWCHVMAHESFEDPAVADLMNREYVCIKVDREERPDLDAIYMDAVQAMVGHGGWPLTVFLAPDGRPFYGGTYFPPTDRYGIPSFSRLLSTFAEAWRLNRDELLRDSAGVLDHLRAGAVPPTGLEPTSNALDEAVASLQRDADPIHGGFGKAPKFPMATALEYLLIAHTRTGDSAPLRTVLLTLRRMADGGINDQIGGGFHRYSVDSTWTVPHFEKMLYDQAQLAKVYLGAYGLTGESWLRDSAETTLGFVARELTSPDGAFYASLDADSEGEEGRFYTWAPDEVARAAGPVAELLCERLGITGVGNVGERSVPRIAKSVPELAAESGLVPDRVKESLREGMAALRAARDLRVRPGRDEKVIVAWNGLAIRAFAEAGARLGRDDYYQLARRAAEFILGNLRPDGRLRHVYDGGQAKVGAFLGDYAALAAGLLALYAADFDPRWVREAGALADRAIDLFWDESAAAFFDVAGDDATRLVVRPRASDDSPTPAGATLFAEALVRLASLQGNELYTQRAEAAIRTALADAADYPLAHCQALAVGELLLRGPVEVAIVGHPAGEDTADLSRVIRTGYRPRLVVALGEPDGRSAAEIPLLANRPTIDGRATAYVCVRRACLTPVNEPAGLERVLATVDGGERGVAA